MQTLKQHVVHGGTLRYLRHDSAATGTPMTLSVFTPPGEGPFPVLIWLSGLTCTEDNFTTKAGAYRAARCPARPRPPGPSTTGWRAMSPATWSS